MFSATVTTTSSEMVPTYMRHTTSSFRKSSNADKIDVSQGSTKTVKMGGTSGSKQYSSFPHSSTSSTKKK